MARPGEPFADNIPNFTADELCAGLERGQTIFLGMLEGLGCAESVIAQISNETQRLGWNYVVSEEAMEAGEVEQLKPTLSECQLILVGKQVQNIVDILTQSTNQHANLIDSATIRNTAIEYCVISELATEIPVAIAQLGNPFIDKHTGTLLFYALLIEMQHLGEKSQGKSYVESVGKEELDRLLLACLDRYSFSVGVMGIKPMLDEVIGEEAAAVVGIDLLVGSILSSPISNSQTIEDPLSPALIAAAIDGFHRMAGIEQSDWFSDN